MKISLVGFMGTGKSTIGRLISAKLNMPFLETDVLIEKEVGKSIPEIFEQNGEDFFRKKESKILNKIINNRKSFILSTGGGIVINKKNRKLLKQNTIPILLEASPEIIYSRIKKAQERRPLLETDDPKEEIKILMEKRKNFYHKFKNRVNTDNKSPDKIINLILKKIGVD